MKGQAFRSLREAIHHTATQGGVAMKILAAELDWSPSQLSMATTLGDDNARPFPADDAHLVKLLRVTEDYSVLFTLADLLGYEVRPKEAMVPRLLEEVQRDLRALAPKVQMLLDMGLPTSTAKGKK